MEEANTLDGNGSEASYAGFLPLEIAAELRAQGVEIAPHLAAPDVSAQTGEGPSSPGGDVGTPASPQCPPGQTREGLEKPERTGNNRHENPRPE
ncbi:MAG: hypothetical protein ACO1SX_13760 [Actinomycetota bacterium]